MCYLDRGPQLKDLDSYIVWSRWQVVALQCIRSIHQLQTIKYKLLSDTLSKKNKFNVSEIFDLINVTQYLWKIIRDNCVWVVEELLSIVSFSASLYDVISEEGVASYQHFVLISSKTVHLGFFLSKIIPS